MCHMTILQPGNSIKSSSTVRIAAALFHLTENENFHTITVECITFLVGENSDNYFLHGS